MKLLFDQNISFRIVNLISEYFPGSAQVRNLQLQGATDLKIWEFARINNFVIITFDADFYDFSSLLGHPPKIIWLRTGNKKTAEIANLLIQKVHIINSFIDDQGISCLEIY